MIQLYTNTTKENARLLASKIEKYAHKAGYSIANPTAKVKVEPDIVIGLGGDGTLLRFLQENEYNIEAKYIGVNCGTLGFLQDFEVDDAEFFVNSIPTYVEQKLNFITLTVTTSSKDITFSALNEFTLQNENDKTFKSTVYIDDKFLEDYVGTGVIFCTPTGSTAMNISSVGSIMYPELEAFQMTPREAIVNNKMHSLSKSICIPKPLSVTMYPSNNEMIKIHSDGVCVYTGLYKKITISYSDKHIIKLTDKKNSFVKKLREKLIV